MFHWEPEGHNCCTKSGDSALLTRRAQMLYKNLAIAPLWFSMEHLWTALMPFLLSAGGLFYKDPPFIIFTNIMIIVIETRVVSSTGHNTMPKNLKFSLRLPPPPPPNPKSGSMPLLSHIQCKHPLVAESVCCIYWHKYGIPRHIQCWDPLVYMDGNLIQ